MASGWLSLRAGGLGLLDAGVLAWPAGGLLVDLTLSLVSDTSDRPGQQEFSGQKMQFFRLFQPTNPENFKARRTGFSAKFWSEGKSKDSLLKKRSERPWPLWGGEFLVLWASGRLYGGYKKGLAKKHLVGLNTSFREDTNSWRKNEDRSKCS